MTIYGVGFLCLLPLNTFEPPTLVKHRLRKSNTNPISSTQTRVSGESLTTLWNLVWRSWAKTSNLLLYFPSTEFNDTQNLSEPSFGTLFLLQQVYFLSVRSEVGAEEQKRWSREVGALLPFLRERRFYYPISLLMLLSWDWDRRRASGGIKPLPIRSTPAFLLLSGPGVSPVLLGQLSLLVTQA